LALRAAGLDGSQADNAGDEMGRIKFIVVASALALLACPAAAKAPPYKSSHYCDGRIPTKTIDKEFADEIEPDGDLKFGISLWFGDGQAFGVEGVAHPKGPGVWVFREMDSDDPTEHCILTIRLFEDGSVALDADKVARCQSSGGAEVVLDPIRIEASKRIGPVVTNFDDEVGTLWEGDNRCFELQTRQESRRRGATHRRRPKP
jgi:hypothetical protein